MTGAALGTLLLLAAAPTATPAASSVAPSDRILVGALESSQGEGRERVALFSDGSLVQTITYRGRSSQTRKLLTADEVAIVREIAREAALIDAQVAPVAVSTSASTRLVALEVIDPSGRPRTFCFDDLSMLPLAVGRARGAFEDLRSRFLEKDVSKEQEWDPSGVGVGALLRRRSDGLFFRVSRDDRFERGLELAEESRQLERLLVLREQLPQVFEAPAGSKPTPAPRP